MPGDRAAIYVRISSDPVHDGLGVARQERECREVASALGATVVGVYSDDDYSAFSGRTRPGFEHLLGALATGAISLIIAWHPDRLYRRQQDLIPFIDAVEAANADVATVTAGSLDLATASGRMTARIVGAVAEHESDHRSERIVAKLDEVAARGRWGGGKVYGYRSTGEGRLKVDAFEAGIIREAAFRVLAGESLHSVCRDLDRRAVPTSLNGLWRHKTLRLILTGVTVRGMLNWRGDVHRACWEPILDQETADRLMTHFGPTRTGVGRPDDRALLTGGLLRCGHCGGRLYTGTRNGVRAYRCEKPPRGRGCGRIGVAAEPAERAVVEALTKQLTSGRRAYEFAARNQEVDRRVEDDESTRRRLAALHSNDGLTRAEWRAARGALDASIRDSRASPELHALQVALRGLPRSGIGFRRAWSSYTLDRRREIVASFIVRIDVQPSPGSGCRFNAARVVDGIQWARYDVSATEQ